MDGLGQVFLVELPNDPPRGELRHGRDTARAMNPVDWLSPATSLDYSSRVLRDTNTDSRSLMAPSKCLQLRTVSDRYKIIEEQASLVVSYGEGKRMIAWLRDVGAQGWLLRKMQRYTVQVPWNRVPNLQAAGAIETIDGVMVYAGQYDDRGIDPDSVREGTEAA